MLIWPYHLDMRTCACGCGEPVTGTWKRGHSQRSKSNLQIVRRQGAPRPAPTPVFDAGQGRTTDLQDAAGDAASELTWFEKEVADSGMGDMAPSLDRDPEPAYMGGGDTAAPISRSSSGSVEIDRKTQRDIEGKLALLLMIPAEGLYMSDPYCAEALQKSLPAMIKAMSPIIAGSPEAVKFFTKSGGWMLWLQLAIASKPFLQAVSAHHITKRVHVETGDDGQPQVTRTDYSAYSAA